MDVKRVGVLICMCISSFECACLNITDADFIYIHPPDGACYYVWDDGVTYPEAKAKCQEFGLQLLQPKEPATYSWMHDEITEAGHPVGYWIGLQNIELQWTWNDGTPAGSTYWIQPPSDLEIYAKLFTPATIWIPLNENAIGAPLCVYKDPTTPPSSQMSPTQSVNTFIGSRSYASGRIFRPVSVASSDVQILLTTLKYYSSAKCALICLHDNQCSMFTVNDDGNCSLYMMEPGGSFNPYASGLKYFTYLQ